MSEFHEDGLSARAQNVHRALKSLQEEIEAVDWYNQRVEAATDDSLRSVLAHNRDEEIEHAAMVLEWLRRNMDGWSANLRKYLFTQAPILEIEESEETDAAQKPAPLARELKIGNLRAQESAGKNQNGGSHGHFKA